MILDKNLFRAIEHNLRDTAQEQDTSLLPTERLERAAVALIFEARQLAWPDAS